MARGETEEEVIIFLTKMKKILKIPPKLVTIDYSKALKSGTKKVYPETLIGHDLFHTSKLLNSGILKELTRLQKKHYSIPIQDYNTIRRKSIEAEKTGKLPLYKSPQNTYLTQAWDAFGLIFPLSECKTLRDFNFSWKTTLNAVKKSSWNSKSQLYDDMCNIESEGLFTKRNYDKIAKKIFRAWRRIIREKRMTLESKKGDYLKAKYFVLQNPKNLNGKDRKILSKYLKQYPWMRSIRGILTKFYSQFKPDQKWRRSFNFLRKLIHPDSHKDLKAAIETIVGEESHILAYLKIWEQYPSLKGNISIRSNHEELNRKINKVASNQYGLRDTESARIRLESMLNCPIIVSEALLTYEKKDL